MSACITTEDERLCEGQNSDVPAVVIDVGINERQVAAVVNNGLHLCHISIDWFVGDGAQQDTPAVHEAIASNRGGGNMKTRRCFFLFMS